MPDKFVLGFDFGLKHLGVAVGQTLTLTASPLTILPACDGEPCWEQVTHLIDTWKPAVLVVGLPYNMDGTVSALMQRVNQFMKNLEKRYHLPVYGEDERLSTKEAWSIHGMNSGKKRQPIDNVAAQIILQQWLNASSLMVSRSDK